MIAGYPKDVDNMLPRYAGVKSHFTHMLGFLTGKLTIVLNSFEKGKDEVI